MWNLSYVWAVALCALAGYLLGSVNSAIILTRIFKNNEDIRTQGSGNAGMTNVLRSVGKLPALLTFVGDFLKCVAAELLAMGLAGLFGMEGEGLKVCLVLAGVGCVLGHMFPLYHGFKGGKGIVTAAAMIMMTDWRVFLLILATFGVVFLIKKIISLASVTCAALYPVYTLLALLLLGHGPYEEGPVSAGYLLFAAGASLLVGALVLWRHRANIGRLIRGEEKPIRAKKKTEG